MILDFYFGKGDFVRICDRKEKRLWRRKGLNGGIWRGDEMRIVSPLLDYTYRFVYSFHMSFFFNFLAIHIGWDEKNFYYKKDEKFVFVLGTLFSSDLFGI